MPLLIVFGLTDLRLVVIILNTYMIFQKVDHAWACYTWQTKCFCWDIFTVHPEAGFN